MLQKRDCYAYKTRNGELKLIESVEHPGEWELSLNGRFLRTYRDPWQAAEDASRSDFGEHSLDLLLKYAAIPSDLDRWQPSRRYI